MNGDKNFSSNGLATTVAGCVHAIDIDRAPASARLFAPRQPSGVLLALSLLLPIGCRA